MNRKALLPVFVSLGIFGLIFAVAAIYLAGASQREVDTTSASESVQSLQGIDEIEVVAVDAPSTRQVVGGDLRVTGNVSIVNGLSSSSLQLIPVSNPTNLQSGQLYTQTDGGLYYYNGQAATNITGGLVTAQNDITRLQQETQEILSQPEGVVTIQGQSGNIVLTGAAGITITGTTVSNNGVLTVQGRAGNVQFTGSRGVSINGTTITNTGVTSIGGNVGDVSVGAGLSISGGVIVNTGITQLVSNSADLLVTANGGGSYSISYTGSGAGGTVALGPTAIQQDSGSNPAIWVNKTGSGNLIQLATGTNASNKFVVDQSGAIINGSINFSQLTGVPSLVNSIGGLTGTIALGGGLSIAGGQLVATTSVDNLVGTANQINVSGSGTLTLSLPQSIAPTSAPTFSSLSLTNALSVSNGGTGATTASGARGNLGAAARGANSDITSLSGLTTALSVAQGGTGASTFTQNGVLVGNGTDAIGTVTSSGANQCLISDASGELSFQSCPGAGGVTSVNGKSGAVTITAIDPASVDSSGSSIVIRDASYSTKGLASFSSANFAVLNGAVNTIQDINTTATPTFAGVNLTSALTVANGGTGRTNFATNGVLIGQGGSALATVTAATAGQCLVSGTGGVLSFSTCPGATGVTSVNGLTGAVSVSTAAASSLSQVGQTITILDATEAIKGLAAFNADNLVVANGVVNTVQNISTSATPSFAGLNLSSALSVTSGGTGRTSLAANSILVGNGTSAVQTLGTTVAGQCLASGPGGVLAFVTCPGAEVVNSINGQTGAVTVTAVDPSSINTAGGVITIRDASYSTKGLASFNGSNFSVVDGAVNTVQDIGTTATPTFEGLSLNTALGVAQGGTGSTSFAMNGLLVGQGSGAVSTVGTTVENQCLVSGSGGYLSFTDCPGSTSVASINGLTGSLTVRGVSASSVLSTGQTITIADATDTVKGLAAFNADNLVVTNGIVNTIQDISVDATPTFAGLTLSAPLSVASGGTGVSSFALNGVVLGNGSTALTTVNASGANQCLVSGVGGELTFITCPGANGVTSINGLQGVLTLDAADPSSISSSGSTITIRDATAARKGLASFDSTNFTVTNGAVNLVQDIGSTATPTFAGLTLTDALTVANGGTGANNAAAARLNLAAAQSGANSDITSLGALDSITASEGLSLSAGGTLSLQGAATVLSQTNGTFTTQFNFADPAADVTYTLQTAAAGTYEICTTVGNCAGVGGGVTTSGGTIGRLSKYVSGSAIGDSIITDDGTTVSIEGALSVNTLTPTAAAVIGATTQSLTLQGSNTSLSSSGVASTNTLTFVTPSGANKTILIPNASGTVAISATGPLVLDANGNLTCPTCLTSGGGGGGATGVSSVNGITGDISLVASDANSIVTAGTTITIADATATRKGLAAFNSQNLVVTNGVVNTIQDISTTASPTFASINLGSPLTVANGGTGRNTLPEGLLIGNGANPVSILAPTGASECLASDEGGNLVFVACPGTSVVNFLNGLNGSVTLNTVSGSSLSVAGNTITIQDATSSVKGLAAFNSDNLTVTNGVVNTVQDISTSASPSFNSLSLSTALGVASGGTGATTAAASRVNLGAASRGANSDITSLSGLTTALSVAQGGTGQSSLTANRVLIGNGSNGVAVSNAATAGYCLVGNGSGAPSFQMCPGSDGVSSLNELAGAVTIDTVTASSLAVTGNNIRIQDATTSIKGLASFNSSNFTITNGAVNTVQSIAVSATPTFAGLNLTSALSVANGGTGRTSLATNGVLVGQGASGVTTVGTSTAGQCLVSGSGGVLSFAACPGSGGVSSVNGLNGAVTIDTSTATSLQVTGNNIRIQDATASIKGLASFNSDSLTVTNGSVSTVQSINTSATPTFAGLTLNSPLGVASGGTGRSTLAANSLLIGNGTSPVSTLGTSVAGKCLVSGSGGVLSFVDCPGADVVSDVNGITGSVSVTAVDPASIDTTGSTITIRDASYTTKGLASFNGGNFTVTNGAVNTIQGIAATDAPTFAGLTLSSALGVASGGTGAGSFATNGVLIGQGTSALTTVGASTAGQCLVSGAGGVLSFASCPGANGVTSLNGVSGAVSLSTVTASSLLTSGNTITIADASDTVKGLAAFNADNLTVTNGLVNTIQDINTTATPTFAGITLTSALSVANGGTGQTSFTANRVLLGNGTDGIAISNEAANGQCLIGNAVGGPSFQSCPVGGNISSGTSQTAGVVTMFDVASNQITDSIISQSGAVVTVGGQLSATTLAGNGSAVTNLNASNLATGTVANARLSANVTLQGNSFNGNSQLVRLDSDGAAGATNGLCLMSTGSGAGAAFQECPGSGAAEGANTSLSNLSNVAINDMLLPGASNSIDIGSSTATFRNLYLGGAVSAAGAINGLTLTSTALQSAGALTLSAGGTNQTLTVAGSGSGGVTINAGAGALTLSGFACSSSANGGKLTTNGAGVVSCADDVGGVNVVGTIDSQTKSANGAVINGATLYLQTADASVAGLLSTGTQTIAGAKTLTGSLGVTNSALFRNATNSTAALTVQNAAGYTMFNVDTSNERTTVGWNIPAASTGALIVGGDITASANYKVYNGSNGDITVITGNTATPRLQNVTIDTGSSVRIGSNNQGVLYTDGNGLVQKLSTGGVTSGHCLGYVGGNLVFQSCGGGAGSNYYAQGGNAFNATSTLGLTDNHALNIIQNNATRIAMPNDGNVLINAATSKFVFINTTVSAADGEASLIVGGRIKSDTGFKVGTTSGVSIAACSGYIQNAVVNGGIITSGNCSSGGSAGQAIVQGGNAFNGTMTLGTTDNFGINLVKQGTTMMAISQDGNIDFSPAVNKWVRIGTANTDSEAQLIVNGRVKSNTGFRVGNYSGMDLTCSNGNQTLGAVRIAGGIIYQAQCSTNNSDLAENYSSTDSLEAGEIVMAAGTAPTAVVRGTLAGKEKMMGVVSTEPAQTLGTEQVPEGYPIALTGRVPVKVNGEGGAIGIGDKVTISSVAGVGKKATSAGLIVGTAVEAFNGVGTGSIEVFVNLMYWSPSVDGASLQAQSGTFESLTVNGAAQIATLTVTGQAQFQGNIVINGHIVTGGGAPAYNLTGAAAVTVDGNDTAGTVTITTGASGGTGSLASFIFANGYGKSPRIILSGQDDASLGARIYPTGKSSAGFELATAQALAPNTTYTFDYFIVE